MTLLQADVDYLCEVCRDAGEAILDVYRSDFDVTREKDASPVTEADLRAHRVIVAGLHERWPEIPVLSEESAAFGKGDEVMVHSRQAAFGVLFTVAVLLASISLAHAQSPSWPQFGGPNRDFKVSSPSLADS